MSNEYLASLTERIAAALDARTEVLEAYLFGSTARGDAGPLSDIDVAVFLDAALVVTPFALFAAELAADLMKALGHSRVDMVVLNTATPLLYHRVLRDGARLLARDLAATTTREGRALSRYCDFLPHLAIVDAAQAERLRTGKFGR
ncbi:MAG: nucleotidyltransferase domain-containing protein [Thermoanaerobaculia bacterium]